MMKRRVALAMVFCTVSCTEEPQQQPSYRNLSKEEEDSLLGTQPERRDPPVYNYQDFEMDEPRRATRAPASEADEFNRKMKEIEQDRRIELLELETRR